MKNAYYLRIIFERVAKNNKDLLDIWLAHIVFSWRWWLGLFLTIAPWILWIKVRDRKQVVRLLFIALIVALVTDLLDVLGLCFGLWYYEWKMVPVTPIYIPWNFTLFPVSVMLLLQFKPEINRFVKAFGFSFFCAFISEPLFAWMGIYQMVKWKHWYSFIIYIALYLLFDKIYNLKALKECANKENAD